MAAVMFEVDGVVRAHYPIIISCKNFTYFRILISSIEEAQAVYDSVHDLLQGSSGTFDSLYAFSYTPALKYSTDGWKVYDPLHEFDRMGVGSAESAWRISDVNAGYSLCPTYPRFLAVPAKISDAVLFHAAKFRSKGRLPTLSYLHKSNQSSITRSSQPLVGIKAKRSVQDEKLVEAIFEGNLEQPRDNLAQTQVQQHNLIIDARPLGNAMANRAMGAGTESLENYKNCDRLFMGIDNIHVMRDSLNKLIDASLTSETAVEKWIGLIENSGWLKHIRNILEATITIIETIVKGQNVLIHCSDGWDRTAQLSSLSQICLDPYYRTMRGFQVLIEKEWLSFGHKFSERCGHLRHINKKRADSTQSSQNKEERETSPVFLQFLECARLLIEQFPYEFEYNQKLLIDMHLFSHNAQFGTFLANCERERVELKLSEKTISVWSFINEHPEEYMNPAYSAQQTVIYPSALPRDISFWTDMYCQWDDDSIAGGCLADLRSTNPYSSVSRSAQDDLVYWSDYCSGLQELKQLLQGEISRLERNLPKQWKLSTKLLGMQLEPPRRISYCQRSNRMFFIRDYQWQCRLCGRTVVAGCRVEKYGIRVCLGCVNKCLLT